MPYFGFCFYSTSRVSITALWYRSWFWFNLISRKKRKRFSRSHTLERWMEESPVSAKLQPLWILPKEPPLGLRSISPGALSTCGTLGAPIEIIIEQKPRKININGKIQLWKTSLKSFSQAQQKSHTIIHNPIKYGKVYTMELWLIHI